MFLPGGLHPCPGGSCSSMCWRPGPSFCVNTPSENCPRVTILFVSKQPRCCQETGVCIQATDLGPDSPSVVPRGRPRREGGMCLPALSHGPCALGKHVSPSLPQESGQAESRIPAGGPPPCRDVLWDNCSSQAHTVPRRSPSGAAAGPPQSQRPPPACRKCQVPVM